MKLFSKIFAAAVLLNLSCYVGAEEVKQSEKDLYEYNNIVSQLSKPVEPYVTGDYVVFTHDSDPRFVGIAFDCKIFSIASCRLGSRYSFCAGVCFS